MEARARRMAMLSVLFFIVLGAGKLQALTAGCVNIYDEADPNGACTTSSCGSSCTNVDRGGGGIGVLLSQEALSQTYRRYAPITPVLLGATPLHTTLATIPAFPTLVTRANVSHVWSPENRTKTITMFEQANLTRRGLQ